MLIYGNYSTTAEKTITGGIPRSWCDYSPEAQDLVSTMLSGASEI